jgi:DNA repair protein RadD
VIDTTLARNPKALIYGVTATPNRGDGKGLREVFSNVADQIRFGELIRSGHLVSPRTFVIDVGTREALDGVKKLAEDYDMNAVASIMNNAPVNDAVVRHWKEQGRRSQDHCFRRHRCPCRSRSRCLPRRRRGSGRRAWRDVRGRSQGDARRLRDRDYHGPRQCRGVDRGLRLHTDRLHRPVAPEFLQIDPDPDGRTRAAGRRSRRTPGVVKTDCIVLDFGTASLKHGSLEQEVDLDGFETGGEAPTKTCPACDAEIPASVARVSAVRAPLRTGGRATRKPLSKTS